MRLPAVLVLVALLAAAWPASAAPTGAGIVVAVLDSGVDGAHPELSGRVDHVSFQPVAPGLPAPVGSTVADPDGQGTAVASVIAAASFGLAPQARILDLQVSARYTGTALDPAVEDAAIDAMDFLLNDPGRAQVVVMSFASRGVSPNGARTLAEQAQGLRDAGLLVLVPTAPSLSTLHLDGSVVTVGGATSGPDCSPSSGGGPAQPLKPDLVAEHTNVRAATPAGLTGTGGTGTVSGTAYAAAKAAGTAALMLDAREGLPVDATAAILRGTAAEKGAPGPDACGFGLLNTAGAVVGAETWVDPLLTYPTKPTPGPALPALAAALAAAAGLASRRRRA